MSVNTKQAAYLKKRELPALSYGWINWFIPLVLGCAVLFFIDDYLDNPQTLPINKIRIHGAFVNIDEAMLHHAIDGVVAGGYFNVDVERVREVVKKLAWVNEASVRRVWPDTLSVNVIEQQPIAIAKNIGLINAQGNIFKPLNNILPKSLPVFDGAANLNKMMLLKYYEMNKLLKKINRKITYLNIDARHAVALKLDNGLKIVLGRGETMHRLERFVSVYPKTLTEHVDDIDAVDLRYTNGMAIGWKNNLKNLKGSSGDMKHV